jgi:DHA1 family bicyclomycin/chloramphenicol resistance-like MFS transporter
MRFSLILSFAFGGLYTLPALLPFVLIGMVGLTPTQYGLATLIQTAAYASGNLVTMQLLRRYEAVRLIPFGIAIFVTAAMILAVGLRVFPPSLATIIGPTALWAFGSAWIVPGATTGALANAGSRAGAASAFMGFLQIGGGLAGSLIAAMLFVDAFQALINVLPFLAVAGGIVYVVLGAGMRALRKLDRPVKVVVDPSGAVGAGGEEIDNLTPPRQGKRESG